MPVKFLLARVVPAGRTRYLRACDPAAPKPLIHLLFSVALRQCDLLLTRSFRGTVLPNRYRCSAIPWWTAFDYQGLLRHIQNQKCALVQGPDACISADGQTTFAAQVADRIRATRRNISYYHKDDLYCGPARAFRAFDLCNSHTPMTISLLSRVSQG